MAHAVDLVQRLINSSEAGRLQARKDQGGRFRVVSCVPTPTPVRLLPPPLLNSFERENSHTTQLTSLKCTVRWLLLYLQYVQPSPQF